MSRPAGIGGVSLALYLLALSAGGACADGTVKVGLVVAMTGEQASTGKQLKAGVDLYMRQHGDTVAGKKIEILLRDSASLPNNTKRLVQELIVNDKVDVVSGFEITPAALVAAPLATAAKVVEVVMAAGSSQITEASPYIVRTSDTTAQSSVVLADWAAKNGIAKVVTLVSDYAPGADAEKSFASRFIAAGGTIAEAIRVPLASPDFAPFLQRAADARPNAIFVFVPSGQGGPLMRQFVERGLDKADIKVIGNGTLTDDDQLAGMGDAVLGVVTAHHYSADHPSAVNRAYVAAFEKANRFRPNFMSVNGYDGIELIARALQKTGGDAGAETLIAAMKGLQWESPRGPIMIDPETRDIVQNEYIRRVERKNGELY